MKNRVLSNLVPIFLSIITIFIISFLWNKISLPFENPQEVVGYYSINNHHQYNDTLRYVLFVFFPLMIYSTAFFLLKKNECNTLDKIFTETKFNEKLTNSENLFYLVIFFIFILFNFFSTELPNNKSDIFHEGQLLSGAINLDITNNLWVSSYSNTGIFYDAINTKIAWILTGFQSIGSMRISHLFLESFASLLLVVFIFNLSEKFNFKEKEETFSFIFLCIISLYLIQLFILY